MGLTIYLSALGSRPDSTLISDDICCPSKDAYRFCRVGFFCACQPVHQWMTSCLGIYEIWWWHLALRMWERNGFPGFDSTVGGLTLQICDQPMFPHYFHICTSEIPVISPVAPKGTVSRNIGDLPGSWFGRLSQNIFRTFPLSTHRVPSWSLERGSTWNHLTMSWLIYLWQFFIRVRGVAVHLLNYAVGHNAIYGETSFEADI